MTTARRAAEAAGPMPGEAAHPNPRVPLRRPTGPRGSNRAADRRAKGCRVRRARGRSGDRSRPGDRGRPGPAGATEVAPVAGVARVTGSARGPSG